MVSQVRIANLKGKLSLLNSLAQKVDPLFLAFLPLQLSALKPSSFVPVQTDSLEALLVRLLVHSAGPSNFLR